MGQFYEWLPSLPPLLHQPEPNLIARSAKLIQPSQEGEEIKGYVEH